MVQSKPCRKAVAAAICQLFTEPSPHSLPRCWPRHLPVECGFGLCCTHSQGFPPFLAYRKSLSQLPGFFCMLSTLLILKGNIEIKLGRKKKITKLGLFLRLCTKTAFLSRLCKLGCAMWHLTAYTFRGRSRRHVLKMDISW